uniref:DUF674 family protein n=1 Tax=Cajanus cajan TaxID=3821 RepID=A0A151R648_CAJCA|nr:hypothetical protein KK1_040809 [Cajanus cajan]
MNKVSVGSLSSLYESVCNMENKHFWTDTCKEMLLQPRSSMESYCHNIKLNIDGTEKTQYFICQNLKCISNPNVGLLSTFKNQKCKCGRLMNRVIHFHSSLAIKNDGYGFVPETAAFIITDDLKVKPDDFQFSCLLMNHRYEDLDAIKLVTVNVTQKDVLDLLKCSLLSTTPLTDVLLLKKQIIDKLQLGFDFGIREHDAKSGIQNMKLKVMLRKSNKLVLFALAEEDFVDFIFSFLTFPLGGVEHMLNGKSCLGSIDNLYKSVLDLDCYRYLRSPDLKEKLVKTPIAHQFKLHNNILPIDEMPSSNYSHFYKYDSSTKTIVDNSFLTALQEYRSKFIGSFYKEVYCPLSYLEPPSSNGSKHGGRAFVKKPSLYMVTDDFVVTPSSSFSAVSFVSNSGVPLSDLEEKVINIGQKEVKHKIHV